MTNGLKESFTAPSKPSPPGRGLGEGKLAGNKGWTPERRAAQAARARAQKPWLHSTGPRSYAGKKRCKMNAIKHGHRSVRMRTLSKLLRAQQLFLARWRSGNYKPPKRAVLDPQRVRQNLAATLHDHLTPFRIGRIERFAHTIPRLLAQLGIL